MREYLVLGLMPIFPVRKYDLEKFDRRALFHEFMNGHRDYNRFQLRPIGVRYREDEDVWDGWSLFEPDDGKVFVSPKQALYQISIADIKLTEGDIVDCLLGAESLTYRFSEHPYVLVPIHATDIPKSRVITSALASELYCRKLNVPIDYARHTDIVSTKHTSGSEWDERVWCVTSQVAGDEQCVYAMLFLRAAFEHIMFYGDDFLQAMNRQELKAERIKEAIEIENSIHNCYKAVEAVYGGTLPKDWQQIEHGFRQCGVELRVPFGFRRQTHQCQDSLLIDALKNLRKARDDRAAHGRVHQNRRSTYFELMEYQMLASHIVEVFLQYRFSASRR